MRQTPLSQRLAAAIQVLLNEPEPQDDRDGQLREYRKFLEQCETEATADFDKTTVALSGGALGISMAFLTDIAPQPIAWSVIALLAPAWFALSLSLLGVLLSFMSSMKSMRYELQCLDGERKKPQGELAGGRWRQWTERFNALALGGCIFGVMLLASFIVINTWSKTNMSKPDDSKDVVGAVRPNSEERDKPEEKRGRITPDRPTEVPSTSTTTTPPPDED